jgi:ABC-type antimicrobial peptide transport system permease subunit
MKSIINGGNTNMKQLIQGLTEERKKQLDHDVIAIGVITFIALTLIMMVFGKQFNGFIYDKTSPVLPRVALAAVCGQFALAGLGITAVCIYRKENFTKFGLTKNNLAPATYIISAIFVMTVSVLVSFLFSRRIKRIDMVEVLKGME